MYDFIFANFAMHIQLDEAETALLTQNLQHTTIKKNTLLLQAGEVCKNIWFVNRGCMRIYNLDREGREHNVLFYPENWWAADLASFSSQQPAFYNISALEDTEVFYLSHTTLDRLYTELPKLERFFRIMIQNGFSLYQQRITANLSMTAEERYRQFRRQYPKLEQRIAQKHIASYLGITPVFLSMLRSKKS